MIQPVPLDQSDWSKPSSSTRSMLPNLDPELDDSLPLSHASTSLSQPSTSSQASHSGGPPLKSLLGLESIGADFRAVKTKSQSRECVV